MNAADNKEYVIKTKVEELGVMLEKLGRTPVSARVFAYLLISDPPVRTFDDIVSFLSVSKSSVSVALKTLQAESNVLYKTYSGDRKKYFMINTDGWMNNLKESAKNLSAFNVLLEDVVEHRKGFDSKEFNADIKSLLSFQIYFTEQIDKAIKNYKG